MVAQALPLLRPALNLAILRPSSTIQRDATLHLCHAQGSTRDKNPSRNNMATRVEAASP